LFNDKFPGFDTDNSIFVDSVYLAVILSVGSTPTAQDTAYWLAQLSDASPGERDRTRNLMLGRIATESFDPPPVSGMTAFDLTVNNQNEVLLGIAIAGLLRIQLTYREFASGYLIPAKIGGELVIIDHIYNLLQSPDYSARFRVTSYEGYIDSVKGGLTLEERAPLVDPDGDGNTNLEDYSFALVSGGQDMAITDVEIVNDAGQQFAVFGYRQAANVKRVEFIIEASTDLKAWSVASEANHMGGTDMGTYLKKRVRIPVPTTSERMFFRVRLRQIP